MIDRVEKTSPAEKPARVSEQDWETQQNDVRLALYILRGKIEEKQKKTDEAAKDFAASYAVRPNALAAQHLAQLSELQKNFSKAVEYYLDAFVLPENGPGGATDRRLIRDNLGNVWREIHGSDVGLGDAILGAYDHTQPVVTTPKCARPKSRCARCIFIHIAAARWHAARAGAQSRQSRGAQLLGHLVRALPRARAYVCECSGELCGAQ